MRLSCQSNSSLGSKAGLIEMIMGEQQFQESLIAFIASLPPEAKKEMRDALVGWVDSGVTSWREYYKTVEEAQ